VHQLKEHEGQWQVLDVRRAGEWKGVHLHGAVLQPLDTLAKTLDSGWRDLDPAKPVAVHCKSGYRSSAACGVLQAHGFREVYNVVGGIDAWSASGFPVEK
jgi:hydroxyacylglutathione hydrolase